MTRFLIVTWDGAGNLVPTLAVADGLVAAGHDVRMIGHGSIEQRCGDHGTRFIPFSVAADWGEQPEDASDFEAEMRVMLEQLCFNRAIGEDVRAELAREGADVVIVDSLLFSALAAAEAAGLPTATIVHTAYSVLREGPLVEMFAPGLAMLNAYRDELGLAPVDWIGEAHDRCGLAVVSTPREMEPDVVDAPNVVRIGALLDAPPLTRDVDDIDVVDGATPAVLVSLSTSDQGQSDLLQRCVDAVASLPVRVIVTTGPEIDPGTVRADAHVDVVRYVPHADILGSVSAVVTHAGLGTTLAALGHGVPMVCVPMGRDQFFNAERVAQLGAGLMLMPDSESSAIAAAVEAVLAGPEFAAAAKRLAISFSAYPGARGAVDALEGL